MYRNLLNGLIQLLGQARLEAEKEALKFRIAEVGVKLQTIRDSNTVKLH